MASTDNKYRVFISYTNADSELAKELQLFIKEEFKGAIIPFLAGDDIQSSDDWKNQIKENLAKGHALIILMTENSKGKPWLLVEWSAFWIADKPIHLFLFDGVNEADLIHPMQDRQYVTATSKDSVNGFLSKISSAASYRPAPYEKAEDLIVRMKESIFRQKMEANKVSYDRYLDRKVELPVDDDKKVKIASYFIDKYNEEVFNRVFEHIKNETKKQQLITALIKAGHFPLAIRSAKDLRTPEIQRDVIIDLLDEPVDMIKVYPLLESVASKNQPQLRIILNYLIDRGEEHSDIFRKAFSYTDNTPTLHKVASHLIENDKMGSDTFQKITEKIYTNNAAEARKLGLEMIENGLEEAAEFDTIVRGMSKKNQIETVKLLLMLKDRNTDLFEKYKASGIVTSEAAIRRLNGLDE